MLQELYQKYNNDVNKDYYILVDILNYLQSGNKINNDELLELSKIRTTKNENAVMLAIQFGYTTALDKLLKPIIIKKYETDYIDKKYEPMYPENNYARYNYSGVESVYNVETGKIISQRETIRRPKKKKIMLYDIFEKNIENKSAVSMGFESNNKKITELLYKKFEQMKDVSTANIESMLNGLLSSNQMNKYYETLGKLSDSAMNNVNLLILVYGLSNDKISTDYYEKNKLIERTFEKSSNNAILSSVIKILEDDDISMDYKVTVQYLLLKYSIPFSKDYLNKLIEINKKINCNKFMNIYCFTSDDINSIIDKPVNVIEAYYGKKINDIITNNNLDGIGTRKFLDSIDLFGDDERFNMLGINELDLSLFKNYNDISDFNMRNLVWHNINVAGYNDDFIIRLFNEDFLRYLFNYDFHKSNETGHVLILNDYGTRLIDYFEKLDVQNEETIESLKGKYYWMGNAAFDYNINLAFTNKMEEIRNKNNKENSINYHDYGQGIELAKIPKEDLVQALDDFSEGSENLKICLKTLWENALPTLACCKGDHFEIRDSLYSNSKLFIQSVGNIAFDSNVDIFSYLSSDFINNPYIRLSERNNGKNISFFGKNKEQLFIQLSKDVLSGKKDNKETLSKKINSNTPVSIYVESLVDLLKEHKVEDHIISLIAQIDTKVVQLTYHLQKLKDGTEEYSQCVEELSKSINQMYDILEPIARAMNSNEMNEAKKK